MSAGFVRATKERSRLRLALQGPGGSGKTYTALAIAKNLAAAGPVGLVDTEGRSARKYADTFEFAVKELESFDPRAYTAAIHEAERAGFGTLILDSLSHAWMGTDGALEMVDKAAKRAGGNSFVAWADVTPHHNAMLQAILRSPMHIIATLRTKTAYVVETNDRGKQVPRKVGLQPIQREGVEYEFDVVGEMTPDQTLVVGKTRCSALVGREFPHAGKLFAEVVNGWLADGAAPARAPAAAPAAPESGPGLVQRDAKPENVGGPTPKVTPATAALLQAMSDRERRAVAEFAPKLASCSVAEFEGVCTRTRIAGGGSTSGEAFRAWFYEAKAQAAAALGLPSRRGPAKTGPASAPAGKAAAS